jgi:putative sigma-54 modulation protein
LELEFTFRNIEPTDAIKAWANKRFQKVTKHLRDPSAAHLVVTVDKHRHRAELTVHSHGEILRATDETDDMYATLDGVMAKVEQSAQRTKEKERSR